MHNTASTCSTFSTPATTTSPWGHGLIFSQYTYHALSVTPLLCQQLGLALPLSVRQAVSKRQAEYVAGRLCARAAIQALQQTPVFPDMGRNRAPQWPAGLTGAITHANGQAAALVGLDKYWQGIGLDLEQVIPEKDAREIAGEILTSHERNWLTELPPSQQASWITLVFSAKESLFKALFPLTQQPFYFHDAQLVGICQIRLLTSLSNRWKAGTTLPFGWYQKDDYILSWILIQAEQ